MGSVFLTYITEQMRTKRYAKRTIQSYVYWIKGFINFNNKKHPNFCHDHEVECFLSFLANQLNVAHKTQALALDALVFLYREIIKKPLTLHLNFNKSSIETALPTVLTTAEVASLLNNIRGFVPIPSKLLLSLFFTQLIDV